MKKFSLNMLVVLPAFIILFYSCKSDPKCEIPGVAQKSTNPGIMSFIIHFRKKPVNINITTAKLKFKKEGWVSMEWDDNSLGALPGLKLLNSKKYTDGCGNTYNYSAALAVNGRGQRLHQEMGDRNKSVNYKDMLSLIKYGWDIENHSYYHEPDGLFNNGTDWYKNIYELDCLIYGRIHYLMNGAVVPTNYQGFTTAAKNFGYLFSSSENTFDHFPPGDASIQNPVQDFDQAPVSFSAFGRIFNDDWIKMEQEVKTAIDTLSMKKYYYFRMGSHGIDESRFKAILDYFEKVSKDRFLFLSTREIMEYRIMAAQPFTTKYDDTKLIVEINTKSVPDRIRWRDMSFLVSPFYEIDSVYSLKGIDKISYNKTTGLVNIFKQVL